MLCPACGSSRLRVRLRVRELRFVRCASCQTLFCTDPPPPEATATLYRGTEYFENPEYDSPETGGYHGYQGYLSDRRHIEAKFAQVIERVERFRTPGRLLDVGAGPGFLLSAARARGWEAEGIDLNGWAARFAREEVGVEVRETTLPDAGLGDETFDAVTMMDLLEHVSEPSVLVAEAARLLRPDGVLCVLTPDAGSIVSKVLGTRWPELQRAPEHLVLFSARGLAALLERHGFEVLGWHSVGKTSEVGTILADIAPAAPGVGRGLQALARRRELAERVVALNPHTKLCLYARLTQRAGAPRRRVGGPPRLPRREPEPLSVELAIYEDLNALAGAENLCDWMFEQYAAQVTGRVAEVGAGTGTFSRRILDRGVDELLALEPEASCLAVLRDRFGSDARVTVSDDTLPGSPQLAARDATLDLVVCQNVLEHIREHGEAVAAMGRALRPGGQLTILVPANPRLFGAMDHTYGHYRRYTPELLRGLCEAAGLEVADLYPFNLLGVPGWWVKSHGRRGARIGPGSLAAYELLLRAWRPIERRWTPPTGLSLIVHARRPV